jgi:hypothetical protein
MQGKTEYAREGNETTLPSNLRRRNPQNTIPASLKWGGSPYLHLEPFSEKIIGIVTRFGLNSPNNYGSPYPK